MTAKKWNILVLGGSLGILLLLAAATGFIDPFLHYHKPLSFLEYPLNEERYQNDGIARHFAYQGLITGTSMCQNFKTSEFEELWKVPAVKTAYSGASYHELNENIRRAIRHNPQLRYVICSMDGTRLIYPAGQDEYTGYPTYLYDENPFNDVEYLLNKEVIPMTLAVVNYTRAGETTPTMDEYGSWNDYRDFGRDAVLASFTPMEELGEEDTLLAEDIAMVRENIEENFLATANANKEITFYLFLPPYSVCYWDGIARTKQLGAQLQAEELAVGLLLTADNIHVFAFHERTDITGNLDNYADTLHYGEWVNSEILRCIYAGEHELTEENYREYFKNVKELYLNYEYDF